MAANWRVVSQQQREDLTPQGTFQKVWDVQYETPSGVRGTVTIAERLYTADYVREVIDARVTTNLAIENL